MRMAIEHGLKNMTLRQLWELFPIVLTPHQAQWKKWADEERGSLYRLLSGISPLTVTHIGSTAIEGIHAKPIIDLLVEITANHDWENVRTRMESAGYICMSASIGRMSFNKGYTPDGYADRVFHIHVRACGDNDEIYFRDYLRSHPETAREYEMLKLSLLPKYKNDRDAYTAAKSDFVTRITSIAKNRNNNHANEPNITNGLTKMKKIIIIGCPGAGKSTFARKLSAKTGLPLHYLDTIWHLPDRTTLSREQFVTQIEKIMAGNEWIIDGNYLHTMPRRLECCDTVVFFDLPLAVCLAGAEERIGKSREDMPWSDDKLDAGFRQWIIDFPSQQLPVIRDLLSEHRQRLNIIVFHTRDEADAFIDSIHF